MSWTGPKDLQAQLARLWERGELLRDAVTGHARFPMRLALKVPASADITDRFDSVRAWAAGLSSVAVLHMEWHEIRHRVQGVQRLPASAWVNSIDDAVAGSNQGHRRFEWVNEERQTRCKTEMR